MTTTNLNYEQYLRWNENKGVNPKTGREIKIGGPTYMEIEAGWNKVQASRNYSREECATWLNDRLVNPKTGKNIKEGGLVYETVRSVCEYSAPNEDVDELSDEKYEEQITQQSLICKMFGQCKKGLQYVSDFGCGNSPCMVKGCAWKGYFGLNFTILPKLVRNSIKMFFPLLSNRCCCFCLGHFILFMTVIINSYVMIFVPKGVREAIKIQSTVDRLNASVNIDDTMSYFIRKESNSILQKAIINTRTTDWLPNISKIVSPASNKVFNSSIIELQDLIASNSS